uniref:Uncharacterized protein n=1 Tax=uncultured marine virus TaxID=186617 RepID=A0A0F7LAP4_9VIRU|nr:hypothetical protein [uncultured marine virus]
MCANISLLIAAIPNCFLLFGFCNSILPILHMSLSTSTRYFILLSSSLRSSLVLMAYFSPLVVIGLTTL